MAISKEKKDALSNLMKGIKKDTKVDVSFASDIEEQLKIKYYKTPSYEVNAILGGGIPKGKIVELFGEHSCGKTSLAIEVISKNQKLDPDFTVGWFETEGSIDPSYLKELGVDMDRLVYWDQKDVGAEKGFDILIGLVNSGEFDMIVVNSIGGLLPKKEIEDDIEKSNVALTARMLSKLFRIVTGAADKYGTSLVFINQLRQNCDIKNPHMSKEVTTGGKALGFFASVRISMGRIKLDPSDPITSDDGLKIRCTTVKNRYSKGNPFKTCYYIAVYNKGIEPLFELPAILARSNILQTAGSWYYWKDNNGDNKTVGGVECKWRSKTLLVNELQKNPILLKELENALDSQNLEKIAEDADKEQIDKIKKEIEDNDMDFDVSDVSFE